LTKSEIKHQYRLAIIRKKTIKTQSKFLRKEFLRSKLALAEDKKDTAKANDISCKLSRERSASMWERINRVTKAPHPGPLMRVQREVDGEVLEFTDEEALIENILDVIQDRFSGAEDAPISNCSITDSLGDFGFTDLGLQILMTLMKLQLHSSKLLANLVAYTWMIWWILVCRLLNTRLFAVG
jgi:hypothetical protein